jgi:recombination DNA repair RAD52 pathway protein
MTKTATDAPIEALTGIRFERETRAAGVSDEVKTQLDADLDSQRIRSKPGSGNLSYLATHDVIRTANRIFGFGRWGYEVVAHELIGSQPMKNAKGDQGWYTGYRCTVRLTVDGCVPVSGVGYGDAFEKQWSAQITTHELACKEAESDALKRALRNFGDQFGLILYAKEDEQRRIAHEKAEEIYNSPADQIDVDTLVNMMGAIGKDDEIEAAIAAEEQAHGHVRHGWVQKALDRATELTNATGSDQPPPAAPEASDDTASQTDDGETPAATEAPQATSDLQPLDDDDRAAKPEEVAALLELAAKAGKDVEEKVHLAVGRHRASKAGGVVSGNWLDVQIQNLMRKLAEMEQAAKNASPFVPPASATAKASDDDVEQAFQEAA